MFETSEECMILKGDGMGLGLGVLTYTKMARVCDGGWAERGHGLRIWLERIRIG